jgi:NAD(P)-dependent dehydrogenase (short-subunit alcohol dehydrogenase family)
MAEALGEAGAKVMLSSRKAADLEEGWPTCRPQASMPAGSPPIARSPEDIRRVADETLQRLGAVDILVNNAGAAWGAPAEDHPVEAWDKVMNLNIRGYFILSQHIAKAA